MPQKDLSLSGFQFPFGCLIMSSIQLFDANSIAHSFVHVFFSSCLIRSPPCFTSFTLRFGALFLSLGYRPLSFDFASRFFGSYFPGPSSCIFFFFSFSSS